MSYTISGELNHLDYSQLRQILKDAKSLGVHFIEKPVTSVVDISFGTYILHQINGKTIVANYDPKFYRQKATIKNVLTNYGDFVDKSKLYNTVKRLIPSGLKFLPTSYNIKEFEEQILKNNKYQGPYIIKKDNSLRQQGVILITSVEEYYAARDKFYKMETEIATQKKIQPKYDCIVSKYITNPLLLDGKKFHLRIHFLLSIISGITKCITYDEYDIITTKKKYKNSDYGNTDIHISGEGDTAKIYVWPDDIRAQYPNHVEIIKKMDECCQFVCSLMTSTGVKKYHESHAGYHLYGADIILTDDFHPYLIEINSKPGFFENRHGFSFRLFSFILDNVVFPVFGIKKIIMEDITLIPFLQITKLHQGDNITKLHQGDNIQIKNFKSPIDMFFIQSLDHKIVGYIGLNKKNYIVLKTYKPLHNISAIVSQLIKIIIARNYIVTKSETIKIAKSNTILHNVATNLHFKLNIHGDYEKII
jgi:hypothetical protein